LNFSSFALEDNCSLDFVEIRTGSNSLSPTLDSYCGLRGPGLLQGPTFSLLFHSDGKGSAKGFNVSVSVSGLACGGLVHSRGDRTVTTPNRPAAYPANAECDWTLDVQKGHRARIAFRGRFDLETTADCSADFVQVSVA
ncbi:cubilin, putative, partial [Ixodes scapularis]